ncbi:MAG: tRNA uridine-5-carboxymethylaminomethyl(34) synthesis GTPase MnmE [Deltaproteobacteria bacterium]|nr:tRNA uridine-5-carboxymethylaminomethyl(34) synthesis GTPase MnmE [Deltaproteobacteria bacterium]MBW2075569.1 tRNA uridine-5-carboxymethylaminomethyl(34) synthesis GTPase MnmE [Deltaproteobacteria bacterium]RLB80699.1 MAG: tRNA uridine-5-carboxymethylaminomethyl(34) synthesis GTPase MnmE [Deltaproteobacteria bacterium]
MDSDTIAAVATPPGAGGIGVVKISGPRAIPVALPLLRPSRDPSRLKSRHLYYGCIVDPETEKTLDEVLFVVMRGSHTYTREDVVEIQAHGSKCGLGAILELVLKQGARLAEPGEFTKRAFLNGRIDLSQAEAVIEVVNAQTAEGLALAARQLKGDLFQAIQSIRSPLEDLLVAVEAAIDFPDDVEDIIHPEPFAKRLIHDVIGPLEALLAHYDEGHVYREGVAAIIIGRPNVGKSSLMNRLLQKERAIVTAVPGTTRDFIEETVNIRGIPLRLIDTAGLHDTDDALEVVGIRFTRQRLDEADLVLFMVDCAMPLNDEDVQIYGLVRNRRAVLVINKIDLVPHVPIKTIVQRFPGLPWVEISALYNRGIDKLKDAVFREVTHQGGPVDLPPIVPNLRHKVAIEKALRASREAAEGFRIGRPAELVAVDLKEALDALGEIIGVTTTEAILDQIFSRFCIGK